MQNPILNAVGRGNLEVIIRQATVNPPSIADGADATQSVAVTDVEIGDHVLPCLPYDGQGFIIGVVPSAANTVDVSYHNASGGVVDLDSGTWTFIILKPGQI